jgi:hypothetical protein
MPANSGLPDNPQRIHLVCNCGKKLVANPMQSGKRLKCPSCGQVVLIPPVRAGVVSTPAEATSALHPNRRKRRFTRVLLMLMLWSLPVVGVVGAGAYLRFDGRSRQQARIDAANSEVREAVKGADGWLKQGSAKAGEDVEQRLTKAMAAKEVSEKANAVAVLEKVRMRRAEFAADSIFDSAKTKLDAKETVEALALLNCYVADPNATKKPEAKQLLADYELANSEKAALQTLLALSDEQFVQFKNTGKLDDGKLTRPVLAEIRTATLRRNLETANQRREQKQLAEAKRQESELQALAAARRATADAIAAKTQSAPKDKKHELTEADVAGPWRHKAGDAWPQEITLHPNGKINDPNGQNTWSMKTRGRNHSLELRWADPRAPGGFWIDTCSLDPEGRIYQGHNQQNMFISGQKGKLSPWYNSAVGKKAKEEHEGAIRHRNEVAKANRERDAKWLLTPARPNRYDEPNSPPNGSARVPGMFKESDREAEERRRQEWENARVRINRVTR